MEKVNSSDTLVGLAVTGCIGAYKSADILRRLQDRGLTVQPVMTRSAQEFIAPLTLTTLAQRKTITSMWDNSEWDVKHISLSDELDVLLVAPATANIIAKFANGIADDFLSTLYISTEKPVVIAPAMNQKMLNHPATRKNLATLQERGVTFVNPGRGYLACGWEGEGRLASVEDIVDATVYALQTDKSLANKKVVITAGPTTEDIDPMRYISNRSSGKMGMELAQAAKSRGADVTVICGPINERIPYGIEIIDVRSAEEMAKAIMDALDETDVLCMAAAVADYKPSEFHEEKIKKSQDLTTMSLTPTIDILKTVGEKKNRPFLVGFAAETSQIKEQARKKLDSKRIDLIIGNPIGGEESVVGKTETSGIILTADGMERTFKECSKTELAEMIFDEIEVRLK